MTREEAEKELCRLLEEAEADIQAGRTIPAEEVFAQLREKFAPRNIVYLTGTPTDGSSGLWTSAPDGRWTEKTHLSFWEMPGSIFTAACGTP